MSKLEPRQIPVKPDVLVVNPDIEPFVSLAVLLRSYCVLSATFELSETLASLREQSPDTLIMNLDRQQLESQYLLEMISESHSTCPVIVLVPPTDSPDLSRLARLSVRSLCRTPIEVSRAIKSLPKALGLALPPLSRHVFAALDFIAHHRAASLTVDRIASTVGVSAGRLAHLFHDELQTSVHDYVMRTR